MIVQAIPFVQGVGIAFGGKMPDGVWAAVMDTEFEANLAKWTANAG